MESGELNRPERPRQCQRLVRTAWAAPGLVATCLLLALPVEARVVDRVVALVDGRVLAWSELDLEARVMLVDRGGLEAATAPLDAQALQNALDLAIAQRAAAAEADKLGTYPVEPSEVDARLRAFEARFADPRAFDAFLAAHDADRAQVAEVLARALRTEKVIEGRVRLRSQLTEAEVRRAWTASPEGRTWEEARVPLRDRLQRERAFVLAREALAQLRVSVPVRVVARPEQLVREVSGP